MALDADGRILGIRARILADLGAYLWPSTAHPAAHRRDADVRLLRRAGGRGRGHRARGRTRCRPARTAARGAPRPQLLRSSATVDDAARELGDRPGRAAAAQPRARRSRTRARSGLTYDSGDYERCLDLALELVEPERRADGDRRRRHRRRAVRRARGRRSSRAPTCTVGRDGRVVVRSRAPRRTARATTRRSRRSPPTGSASSSTTSSCASATARGAARDRHVRAAARWRWAARRSRSRSTSSRGAGASGRGGPAT